MTNAELLAKIKAEIERRIALYSSLSENTVNPNRIDEDNQILSFLSTLESEKPMNQDELEKEIRLVLDDVDHEFFPVDPGEELSETDFINSLYMVARHFAQWGAEHLKK